MPYRKLYDAFAGGLTETEIAEGSQKTLSILLNIIEKNKASGFRGCLPALVLDSYSAQAVRLATTISSLIEKLAAEKTHVCYLRCHIAAKHLNEAKKLVARVRRYCVIVSMELVSREITAFACRDRRVDIVTIVPEVTQAIYRGDISYAFERGKIFELTLTHLLQGEDLGIARRLASGRFYANKLARKGLPVILSSGPRLPYEPVSYRAMLSFAKEILEVSTDTVARSMGLILENKLKENIEKISGERPVEGVFIEK